LRCTSKPALIIEISNVRIKITVRDGGKMSFVSLND